VVRHLELSLGVKGLRNNYVNTTILLCSRYSDWLRAAVSGNLIPVGARFSAPIQTGTGGQSAFFMMRTGSSPGVKSDRAVLLTTHSLLVPWSRKSRAIPLISRCVVRPVENLSACTRMHFTFTYTSTPPVCRTVCTDPQYLYNDALYLYLYL